MEQGHGAAVVVAEKGTWMRGRVWMGRGQGLHRVRGHRKVGRPRGDGRQGGSVSIGCSDASRIVVPLHELKVMGCYRCVDAGRCDLWCSWVG